MSRTLIDRAGVAARLGITVEKFYRRYPELRAAADNPFPGPVLGNQSGARWDPLAIDRWIERGGEHPAPSLAAPPPETGQDDRESRRAARRNRAEALARA